MGFYEAPDIHAHVHVLLIDLVRTVESLCDLINGTSSHVDYVQVQSQSYVAWYAF